MVDYQLCRTPPRFFRIPDFSFGIGFIKFRFSLCSAQSKTHMSSESELHIVKVLYAYTPTDDAQIALLPGEVFFLFHFFFFSFFIFQFLLLAFIDSMLSKVLHLFVCLFVCRNLVLNF